MPPVPTPIARLLSSSRFWTALGALAITVASVIGLDPDKATKVITAVVTLAGVVIAATGYEDAATKSATIAASAAPAPAASSSTGALASPPAPFKAGAVLTLLFLLPALLLCGGCQNVVSPAKSYTDADNATFNAVAPEYQTYVTSDPSLSVDQKQRREDTLATWGIRLRSAGEVPATLPATMP